MRRCLEGLRSAGPITSRNIAVKIITDRGEDPEDRNTFKLSLTA